MARKDRNPCWCQFSYAADAVQRGMEAVEQFLVFTQQLQSLCLAHIASISHDEPDETGMCAVESPP